MPTLLQDIRYALRQMRKSPGFTLTVVLTLALGIGANTAIFSVVNAVLRHPEGVDHPGRVAVLHTDYKKLNLDTPVVSVPDYADAASLHSIVEAAAIEEDGSFNIEHNGEAEHLHGAKVSRKWFQVYGAHPILGHNFTAEDEQPNAAPVAVLSYGLWQQEFGGAADVLGKMIELNQRPYRVIGVMRSDFDRPATTKLWVPMDLPASDYTEHRRFWESYEAVIRLRPGATLAQLNAGLRQKMQEEFRRGGRGQYARRSGWSLYAVPYTRYVSGALRKPLLVLFGVVVLVLLIAAANVAGLFLARSSARSREFAIRAALGASTGRMVRQLVIETMLLAGFAALIGVLGGPMLGRILLHTVPHNLAAGFVVKMQPVVMLFTAGVALLTALIAGIGPGLTMRGRAQAVELREGGRNATASAGKQRLRSTFVMGEVAMAFLLLCGAGLFLTSLRNLQRVNPGFDAHRVMAGDVDYVGHDFLKSQAQQANFVHSVVTDLAAQHGVVAAAAAAPFPFSGSINASGFYIEGRAHDPEQAEMHSDVTIATPGYLQVMRIPLLEGRWFTAEDRADTQPVVVIDQRLAKRWWPHRDPIGQHMSNSQTKGWATVIGVVGDVRLASLTADKSNGMRYYSYGQSRYWGATFLVRTQGNPKGYAAVIRHAVGSANASQAVARTYAVNSLIAQSLAGRRLVVWMLGAFAGLALLLSIIGIYGLISFVTTQRTGEMGVRMALGAQRSDVMQLVLASVLRWTGVGMAFGAAFSVAAYLVLRHFFADLGGGVMTSILCAAVALTLAGAMAGWLPARRAARVDPMEALRNE